MLTLCKVFSTAVIEKMYAENHPDINFFPELHENYPMCDFVDILWVADFADGSEYVELSGTEVELSECQWLTGYAYGSPDLHMTQYRFAVFEDAAHQLYILADQWADA